MRVNGFLALASLLFVPASLVCPQSNDQKKYTVAEGKVTNSATGEAIVRAMVTIEPVLQKPRDPDNDDPGFATETDDMGVFHFARVPPGKYNLKVDKPGFLRTNYGAHRAGGPGVPIELLPDDKRTDLDMKMAPEGIVSGTVTDDSGEAARHCMVQLMKRGWANGRSTLLTNASSQTDRQGNFQIAGVEPGRYYLRADCWRTHMMFGRQPILVDRDGNVIKIRPVATYFGDSTTIDGAAQITVPIGQEISGETIRLRREAVYHVRGKLIVPPGESAASYNVFLASRTSGNFFAMDASARPKRDGTFEIDNVQPGTYQIEANHGNHFTWIPKFIDIANDIDNFEAIIPAPIQLHGRIRIEGQPSTPVSAISLYLVGSNGMAENSAEMAMDGTFNIENVTLDRYGINFEYPGETAFIKSVRVGDKEMPGRTLDLTEGAGSVEIVVSLNSAKLDVSVMKQASDSDQQVPAEAVNVVLVPEVRTLDWLGGVVLGSTDKSGAYTFKNLIPGKYRAYAADGLDVHQMADPEVTKAFESYGVEFEIAEKESKQIQLKLISADEANELLEKLGL